jgi:ribosomal protein S10
MKQYNLTITSKTEESLKNFIFCLKNPNINYNVISRQFKKKIKKQKFSILKSPHVYKTAQEQFESRFFTTQIHFYSNDNFKSLIFLKKIKNNLFPDIRLKIKISTNKTLARKVDQQIFNPDNFKLNILQKNLIKGGVRKYKEANYKKVEFLFKLFDTYGELIPNIMFR